MEGEEAEEEEEEDEKKKRKRKERKQRKKKEKKKEKKKGKERGSAAEEGRGWTAADRHGVDDVHRLLDRRHVGGDRTGSRRARGDPRAAAGLRGLAPARGPVLSRRTQDAGA